MGVMKLAAKTYTLQGGNGSKGEYEGQHQRQRLTGEIQNRKMVSASIAGVQAMLPQSELLTCHRKSKIILSQVHLMSQERTNQTNQWMTI